MAQVNKGIDFKNNKFYQITIQQLFNGKIKEEITNAIFEEYEKNKEDIKNKEEKEEVLPINIAVKTIKTRIEAGGNLDENLEELTGIFFVSALLIKETSTLKQREEKEFQFGWFPREVLAPIIEPELAIADARKIDEYLSNCINEKYQVETWNDFINLNKKFYEEVTGYALESNYINNINRAEKEIELEENLYLFLDTRINPTYSIKELYNDILADTKENKLYENFINLKENKPIENYKVDEEAKSQHFGQMNGMFRLSSSQRETITQFQNLKEGEVLAINGPPGTGKTTLLQSMVATSYVKAAIKEDKPPIIVATSTNNQAVTNIIESFGKIKVQGFQNLEKRWIYQVDSFAVYFPSKQKRKEAQKKGFQYTSIRGEDFVEKVDTVDNIEKSKNVFIKNCMQYLIKPIENLEQCKQLLHMRLLEIDRFKIQLIRLQKEAEIYIKNSEETQLTTLLQKKQEVIKKEKIRMHKIEERFKEWKTYYKEINLLYRTFKFNCYCKEKISNKIKFFANEYEPYTQEILTFAKIENLFEREREKQRKGIINKNLEVEHILELVRKYDNLIDKIEEYGIKVVDKKLLLHEKTLDEFLDTHIRYVEFWLAVHYYECRWLMGEDELTTNQKGKNFQNVVEKFYHRLSMLTPCLVMTFYMLPKEFLVYQGERNYLYNFIDLLIVDEAGQVSTEIGACSFALAKKAVVVGDSYQMEPIWSIDNVLDQSLAMQEHLLQTKEQFALLQELGITTSNSSIMKMACKTTAFTKFRQKGMFLSEHRRCLDPIITYCNQLVYQNKLEPLRGKVILDGEKKEKDPILPTMGYKQINMIRSERVGTSRRNQEEAKQIAQWLQKNYARLEEFYSGIEDKILGIITPFTAQVLQIKNELNRKMPRQQVDKITVGTIHTFQGAERKVIILSTTYGKEDGCFFIDNNRSLMNVAVSRAEDSFLVFGDIQCLQDSRKTASGLLKESILENQIE